MNNAIGIKILHCCPVRKVDSASTCFLRLLCASSVLSMGNRKSETRAVAYATAAGGYADRGGYGGGHRRRSSLVVTTFAPNQCSPYQDQHQPQQQQAAFTLDAPRLARTGKHKGRHSGCAEQCIVAMWWYWRATGQARRLQRSHGGSVDG